MVKSSTNSTCIRASELNINILFSGHVRDPSRSTGTLETEKFTQLLENIEQTEGKTRLQHRLEKELGEFAEKALVDVEKPASIVIENQYVRTTDENG